MCGNVASLFLVIFIFLFYGMKLEICTKDERRIGAQENDFIST